MPFDNNFSQPPDIRFPVMDERAMNTPSYNWKRHGIPMPQSAPRLWCARCGGCKGATGLFMAECFKHTSVSVIWDPDHAARIRARYELGKKFNSAHDTTTYRDPDCAPPDAP